MASDTDTLDALRQIMLAAIKLMQPVLRKELTYQRMGEILTLRDQLGEIAERY